MSKSKERLTDILLTVLLVKFIIIISVMNQSIVNWRQHVYHYNGFFFKLYDVWALVKKDFKYEVDGAMLSVYCTCIAALLGSCNHVAGLLFRVEPAALIGVTHPSCTFIIASWNAPSKKKQPIPGQIKYFLFKSGSYTKKSLELDTLDRLKKKGWETNILYNVE